MAMIRTSSYRNAVTIKRNLTAQESKEVSLYFNNLVLYVLLRLNYTQFLIKAKGGTDNYGTTWTPLAEKTIKYKRRKGYTYSGKVAINIRTRALMLALKPNQFSNGVYIPGPNQEVKVTTKTIYFHPDLPYIDNVDKVRAVIVEDMDALVEDAVQASLSKFQNYLRARKF